MENLESYQVMALSQGTSQLVFTGTYEDCREYCENMNWELLDENDFLWELEIF